MIVSWNWLKEYVTLDMDRAELETRLMMAGLNHESTTAVGGDFAIDLEITSNRADCLGHIGVAREVAVLFGRELKIPDVRLDESQPPVAELTKVQVKCKDLCPRYTARLIRGVKVGPSPRWLAERLEAVGIAVINNIVDITNYVLLECGQPLHAFDFAKLKGGKIIVRPAREAEKFTAIDHRVYELDPTICVIADAKDPVALGGVMGGAETEISASTTDVLIEAAEFDPLSIRRTARKLKLHSDSSHRFERGIDPQRVDWASRRCCQLIVETAGGTLAAGVINVGGKIPKRTPIGLRLSELPRVLGIAVEPPEVQRILAALGCEGKTSGKKSIKAVPPSWRRDLSREIDLIEEVARIHGYDKIPEDVGVPMAPSHRGDDDRVLGKVRRLLTAAGFDEAMTCSIVPQEWSDAFSPWCDAAAIVSPTPMQGILGESTKHTSQADRLRRSIVPSLLESRRINESLSNPVIELFETAKVYLPTSDPLPDERRLIGLTSGGDFLYVKGVVEGLATTLNPAAKLETIETSQSLLHAQKSCELKINGRRLGFMGELSASGLEQFRLRASTTIAELDLAVLGAVAELIPQHVQQSLYPAIARDFNFVVDESVRWSDLSATVRQAGGAILEAVEYKDTYRDPHGKDGAGKKRLLLSATFRAPDRTLTGDEAEQASQQIIASCEKSHGARLL